MKKSAWIAPTVRSIKDKKAAGEFPVDHYSQSSFGMFSSNPFMFKVNQINGDYIDSTTSASAVLGKACHKAMQAYLGGNPDFPTPEDEGEAIKLGHEVGLKYLNEFHDGYIEFGSTIPNREKLNERYAFAYFGYLKEYGIRNEAKDILLIEKMLKHQIEVDGRVLPVALKCYPDVVYEDHEGRICIDDHKFTSRYSAEDETDGEKLIQAVFLFLTVAAELGRNPYKVRFREFKITANQDKGPQTHEFEIIYEQVPLAFDLFYRFYEDVTSALLGQQVFVPNLRAMFDREVSILAYIHRLDVDEERAKRFKEMKVENITDFLKKRIQKDGSMKKYLDTVAKKFISANTLNYKNMTIEDKIKMKLAEHGLGVEFDSKVEGGSVTLYRYEPSIGLKMAKIEAYAKDIEQAVQVSGIRVLAPIPDSGLVGFEVPRKERTFPDASPAVRGFEVPLGVNVSGETVYFDLREAPHLLIAGATGAGKSVCMSHIIEKVLSIPNTKVHLIDPKMVELSPFKARAESYSYTTKDITEKLQELVVEMNARYRKLQEAGARNIREYKGEMAYEFVFIDEFADLVMTDRAQKSGKEARREIDKLIVKEGKKIAPHLAEEKLRELNEETEDISSFSCEEMIMVLAQKSRAAGIHIVMATQRPSVNIISGSIKANFPTRIAFKTSSSVDSIVIIDQPGAEKLLGKGDMLFQNPNGELQRLQGFNI